MKNISLLTFFLLLSVITKCQISDSTACDRLEKKYDEFEKETSFHTPILLYTYFEKVISKTATSYYLSLYSKGKTISSATKGVKIILSNNQILSFPTEKISLDASRVDGYSYRAFIKLDAATLQLIKKYQIRKWRLYIYDNEQTTEEAELFRNMINCIIPLNANSQVSGIGRKIKPVGFK